MAMLLPSDVNAPAQQQRAAYVGPENWRWSALCATSCVGLGLIHILNLHPIGDGLWFWYAALVRHGSLLYRDLHFPLQPLYVLLTALFQHVFGPSWLASKILPICQLVAYCASLLLVVRRIPWPDWARALLLAAIFAVTIASPFYRFDDYHITSDALTVAALALLLHLRQQKHTFAICATAAAIGIGCGLCAGNRLNDGTTLLIASTVATGFLATRYKAIATLLVAVVTPLTLLVTVLLTRDTVGNWWLESVVHAAAIKGGTGNAITALLTLPVRLAQASLNWRTPVLVGYSIVFAIAFSRLLSLAKGGTWKRHPLRIAFPSAVMAACCFLFWKQSLSGTPVLFFSLLAAQALYLLCFWILAQAIRGLRQPQHPVTDLCLLTLFLVPLGQLLAGAATASRELPDLFPPVAFGMLLLPILFTGPRVCRAVPVFAGICVALVFSTVIAKARHPYFWHHYNAGPVFRNRQWFKHPDWGPMYLEIGSLQLMRSMCARIAQGPANPQLLSLPYPYPNYFCGITPWNGYVQTWYDTSSRQTIQHLIEQLQQDPPTWIAYQHDDSVMSLHEKRLTAGQPLPHRRLNRLISSRVLTGQWTVALQTCFEGSDWMLIRTAPQAPSNSTQTAAAIWQVAPCVVTQ